MGIHGLTKLIADNVPSAIKRGDIKQYFGRKVAIDASMCIYQFLIAVRGQDGQVLQNLNGETTSHLLGLFYRTVRMVDNGIKPVYVFDGKPPTFKSGELAKRTERRAEAQKSLEEAQEKGDQEAIDRFTRRTVKVSREHNQECKELLKLMGIPFVEAPCEAEAQCAALCKAGKVYGAASEDMDTLTFGSPILLRHLTYSEAKKEPIMEVRLDTTLAGLGFTMDQFVDLCILLGCDYSDTIKGIGAIRAMSLMQQHKSIEEILKAIDSSKYPVGDSFDFESARSLFKTPEVLDPEQIDLKWLPPQEEALYKFLVEDKGFNKERVLGGIEKLKGKSTGPAQSRLDSFFTAKPREIPVAAAKRKTPAAKTATPKKAKAGGGRLRK
ncbi:Elongation of fatty acids protein 2 [Entomophthora muscae]|uniref:Elongation of fatty acids protein 2 n=1 Tax=Entomophthora muscae TaxID=34485 RepID=A0ACC2TWY6_9FUNG|nr:Elongation of fatty acids protein 2 [Entomophthora muscae]